MMTFPRGSNLAIAAGAAVVLVVGLILFRLFSGTENSPPPKNIQYTGKQLEDSLAHLSEYVEVLACIDEYKKSKGEIPSALADRISVLAQKGRIYCATEKVSLKQIVDGPKVLGDERQLKMIEPRSCSGILHELNEYCPNILLPKATEQL